MTASKPLFSIPDEVRRPDAPEQFETLLQGPDDLLVERIVSWNHATPEGEWYDQDRDEWVAVIEGEARLGFEDGRELVLKKGEHAFLPKGLKHRVLRTSAPCVWLALHGNGLVPLK